MALTLPHTFVAGGALDPSEVNDNFQAVTNKVSGGIVNEDISGSANINVDKLSGQFERVSVQMVIPAAALVHSSAFPVFMPFNMPNDNLYTIDSINWVVGGLAGSTTLVGGTTKTGRLRWVTLTASTGDIDQTGNTIFSGVAFATNRAGTITPSAQPNNLSGVGVRGFYFDLTTTAGAGSTNGLLLTINLKRKIQAS
jgi:hypothetical protein